MTRTAVVAAALLAAACGSAPQRVILPDTKPAIVIQIGHYDPASTVPVVSDDVSFAVEGHTVPGTIVHPTTGVWPAVVMMAGAGPTDRNWNNALLGPGTNGSGKQLAQSLAEHGAIVLVFDKAGSGGNKLALEQISMDTYVDEIRGALTTLRGRPDVDKNHMFLVGHDEGAIHATRAALGEGGRIAGVALLSAPGRTLRDITMAQFAARMKAEVAAGKLGADAAKAQQDTVSSALDQFIEGRDVDPKTASELKPLADPKTSRLARDILGFDPAAAVAKLRVPVLIVDGLKDLETDPQLDGERLQQLAKDAGIEVLLFLGPDANHVLKHETKSTAVLRADLAAVQAGYSAANIALDDTTVSSLGNWIAAHDKGQ